MASAIASCVSGLPHVSSKSSDEEKEMFLARVEWLPVTSRSHGQMSQTDKCLNVNISESSLSLISTCSCLGQTINFECTTVGGFFTVWSGSAFMCQGGEISLQHLHFLQTVGSCNNRAIVGQGVAEDNNRFTSRLSVTMTSELVGRTVTCSVDDGATATSVGTLTLSLSVANIFPPPVTIRVESIDPEEITFSWSMVQHGGCPSFQYNISATNCGTCTPSLTNSNISVCTNFLSSEPLLQNLSNVCSFRVQSITCGNISGIISSPIQLFLKVPEAPSVNSVPYYDYRTSHIDKILSSIFIGNSFNISDDLDGSAMTYTVTYADTDTGAICYSDTIMTASCDDGICQHSYDVSLSTCPSTTNITIHVFATNVLGNSQESAPINLGGVNAFVTVTFDVSTRIVLCQFLMTPTNSYKQCIANVTYGMNCDKLLGSSKPAEARSSNVLTSPFDFEFIDGVSQYCLIVVATCGHESVIVEGIVNLFNFGEERSSNTGYITLVVVAVIFVAAITVLIHFLIRIKRHHTSRAAQRQLKQPENVHDTFLTKYFDERKQDVNQMKENSKQPYSRDCVHDLSIKEFHFRYSRLNLFDNTVSIKLVGRIEFKIKEYELIHFNIKDVTVEEGIKLQITADKESTEPDTFGMLYENSIKRGDIVRVNGFPKKSDDGKLYLSLKKIVLISPCLRLIPNPEPLHFSTKEKGGNAPRYLNFIMNDGLSNKFILRTKMITFIRKFLDDREFLEVETPIKNDLTGGAATKLVPTGFKQDDHLRFFPVVFHKMLLVGGFKRVYEIGKQFDSKEIDRTHNPEFTSCEIHLAYTDYNKMMGLTEAMISEMVMELRKENKFKYHYDENDREKMHEVDFTTPFTRIEVIPELKRCLPGTEFPLSIEFTTEGFKNILDDIFERHKIKCPRPRTTARMLKKLIEQFIVNKCMNPTFIINYPQILRPLAQRKHDDEGLTECFELIICKQKICNGYTDVCDPESLRKLLKQQKKAVDDQVFKIDERYYEALEYGLPPTVGCRMGIDRMAMILTDSVSVKEVILFPAFKPDKKKSLPIPYYEVKSNLKLHDRTTVATDLEEPRVATEEPTSATGEITVTIEEPTVATEDTTVTIEESKV